MAIFRARGDRALTTCLPMRTSPAVCLSRPAIMRRRVVFPQPEGPRRTRNSPSFVERSTPSTALTSPKYFFIPRVSTGATDYPFSCRGLLGCQKTRETPPTGVSRQESSNTLSVGGLNEPSLLPLGENALAGRIRFRQRLLRRCRAARRLGTHRVDDPRAEDFF